MLCSRVEYVVWDRYTRRHLLFGKEPVESRDTQPKYQVLAKFFTFFKVFFIYFYYFFVNVKNETTVHFSD